MNDRFPKQNSLVDPLRLRGEQPPEITKPSDTIGKVQNLCAILNSEVQVVMSQQDMLAERIWSIGGTPIEKNKEETERLYGISVVDRLEMAIEQIRKINNRNEFLYKYLGENL
jgi:hypothetical protein